MTLRISRRARLVAAVSFLAAWAVHVPASSESRLKDVITLQGVMPTPLVGYGLVVGLNKTGDKRQTIFST